MIKIENYTKKYGSILALDELSLEVETGSVYGFLGPNGAGKTTTMRLLTGLAKPDNGKAWIMGKQVGIAGEDTRSFIGVLPEEPAFYTWMTPREYLRDYAGPLFGITGQAGVKRADEILELTGLSDAANRRIGGFSRGMRQRLGLAQALIHEPHVLLLDEPVSALDPAGRKEVLDLIVSLRGTATVLLSTHILGDVERVCDVIGIINKGKLILQERSDALMNRYALPLIEIDFDQGLEGFVQFAEKIPVVEKITCENSTVRLLVKEIEQAQKELIPALANDGILVRRFQIVQPSLEDIFLRLTEV
ncbi:MAG: ABC transporter ATP-binding protein [Chloroflexi bacterium]|nr:MAG: ABC transporter ATP-binding protein [Chloroflexota bacterium]